LLQQFLLAMRNQFTLPGKVYLVGAGPGSAGLLTLRALEVLQMADVVLHDDLVSDDVLAMIPSQVSVHSVGKRCGTKKHSQEEINRRMIAAARSGQVVVRLKGGDPLVFGRTQEEISALRDANIEFEIVPGITAAAAAAASAQIPLTERRGASKLVFVSNHSCAEKGQPQITKALAQDATLVFYMLGEELSKLKAQLVASGLSEDLPCLLVSQVARPGQRLIRTTVRGLSLLNTRPSPNLLIVGATVATARADEHIFPSKANYSTDRWHLEGLSLEFPAIPDNHSTKLAV
jgi:uroporphyrin-III C-methyltransferase